MTKHEQMAREIAAAFIKNASIRATVGDRRRALTAKITAALDAAVARERKSCPVARRLAHRASALFESMARTATAKARRTPPSERSSLLARADELQTFARFIRVMAREEQEDCADRSKSRDSGDKKRTPKR
jgi:hypothetical protein